MERGEGAGMTDEESPSRRLVEQRVRNRIMEELLNLSEGDVGVPEVGPDGYFENFFDWFPYEGEPNRYPAMTSEEIQAVRKVCRLMQQAIGSVEAAEAITSDDLVASGWPKRIAPLARNALQTMLQRGRFSEEHEEEVPSTPIPWPPLRSK